MCSRGCGKEGAADPIASLFKVSAIGGSVAEMLNRRDPMLSEEKDLRLNHSHASSSLDVPAGMRGTSYRQRFIPSESLTFKGVVRDRPPRLVVA